MDFTNSLEKNMSFPRWGTLDETWGSQKMWSTAQQRGELCSKFYLLELYVSSRHSWNSTEAILTCPFSNQLRIFKWSAYPHTPSWQPAIFTGAPSPDRRHRLFKTIRLVWSPARCPSVWVSMTPFHLHWFSVECFWLSAINCQCVDRVTPPSPIGSASTCHQRR